MEGVAVFETLFSYDASLLSTKVKCVKKILYFATGFAIFILCAKWHHAKAVC